MRPFSVVFRLYRLGVYNKRLSPENVQAAKDLAKLGGHGERKDTLLVDVKKVNYLIVKETDCHEISYAKWSILIKHRRIFPYTSESLVWFESS